MEQRALARMLKPMMRCRSTEQQPYYVEPSLIQWDFQQDLILGQGLEILSSKFQFKKQSWVELNIFDDQIVIA